VLGGKEERVVALTHEQFQRSFHQVVVHGGADDRYKSRQRLPMALHRENRFTQRAIGFNQVIINLLVKPRFEPVHDRATLFLVVGQAVRRA